MNFDTGLLDALERLTTIARWRHGASLQTNSDIVTDAIEGWIAEHSAEFNRSEPFGSLRTSSDAVAAVLLRLIQAVEALSRSGARPGLDLTTALTESFDDWVALSWGDRSTGAGV